MFLLLFGVRFCTYIYSVHIVTIVDGGVGSHAPGPGVVGEAGVEALPRSTKVAGWIRMQEEKKEEQNLNVRGTTNKNDFQTCSEPCLEKLLLYVPYY